tara:strand:+ start:986 stop:1177 length:192 start_codon:yes stop_codon:yes gene_type:complete
MSSITPKIEKKFKYKNEIEETQKGQFSYRKDFPNLEDSLGHVPNYDEEQESEVPKDWYEPLKE